MKLTQADPLKTQPETQQPIPRSGSTHSHPIAILVFQLLLTLPIGFGLATLHIGGTAWILSGVVAGVLVLQVYRFWLQTVILPNAAVRKVGQTLVGMMIGFAIANSDLAGVATHLPIFTLLTLLLLSGGAIGYLFAYLSQINLLTAMLATVPGGISIMSSIAADYQCDVPLVSLVQGIWITSVVILIPFMARTIAGDTSSAIAPQTWLSLDLAGWGWLLVAISSCLAFCSWSFVQRASRSGLGGIAEARAKCSRLRSSQYCRFSSDCFRTSRYSASTSGRFASM